MIIHLRQQQTIESFVRRKLVRRRSPLAMIAGVAFGTLRAYISAINVGGIVKLATGAKIIRLDGKRTGAFFAVLLRAPRCDTVISYGATIAFWTYRVMLACLKCRRFAIQIEIGIASPWESR